MHAITLPITKVIKYLRVSKYIKADIYTVQLDSTDSNGRRRFEQSEGRRLQSKIVWVWLIMAKNLFSKTIISQIQKIATAIIADQRLLCHTAAD